MVRRKREREMGTHKATDDFSPGLDAQSLNKACEGWRTDEKAIALILGHRDATQRKQLMLAYAQIYQEDLVQRLKSKLSGNLQRAVWHWLLNPLDRYAVLANAALKKGEPDYQVILEISCIESADELLGIKRAYQLRYKHSLEEDVASHTAADIRKLLLAMAGVYRYEGDEIDEKTAHSEANILHGAIQEKDFHHDEIIRILSTRSKAQIIATFNHYKHIYGSSITKSLSNDPTDEFMTLLRTAIRCIKNSPKHFEKVLRHAISKMGMDEEALSRVIVTRAEKDLREIKELYFKRHNTSLDDVVAEYTTADFRTFLLALLGNEFS